MAADSFCERGTLWGIIQQPMNSFSGLSFLVTAYVLAHVPGCEDFVWSMTLLALATFGMHASGDVFMGHADMASMFLNVVMSLVRNTGGSREQALLAGGIVVLFCTVSPRVRHLNTFMAVTTLWILSFLPHFSTRIACGYGVFLLSLIAWIADQHPDTCRPHSLLQGHTLWHIGSALGFILLIGGVHLDET